MCDPDSWHGRRATDIASRWPEPIEMFSTAEQLACEVESTTEAGWTAADCQGHIFVDWYEDLSRIDP